ncbi:MAG: type II toxin-antitoxin system RelE/ParE family toxin [Pseudonocardiales bacterium]|nr:type II toxin-antitoxin system RelE/ParE family toxin [Pseudonocardiales bacterium]
MPPYRIEVLPAASKTLRKLDPPVARRIRPAIDRLAINPRPPGTKALTGKPGLLRIRVGDYRIVYQVQDTRLVVLVISVDHRREVYERL